MTPSEAPKALQASECSELLDPTRASCWISAQHQPGKFIKPVFKATILFFCITTCGPSVPERHKCKHKCTSAQVHKCTSASTSAQVHKYTSASTSAQVQAQVHKCTTSASSPSSWDKSPTKIQRFTLMCPIHGNL